MPPYMDTRYSYLDSPHFLITRGLLQVFLADVVFDPRFKCGLCRTYNAIIFGVSGPRKCHSFRHPAFCVEYGTGKGGPVRIVISLAVPSA